MENNLIAVIISGILTGGIASGIFAIIERLIDRKTNNFGKRISNLEANLAETKKMVESLTRSQKYIQMDKIRHLCATYITRGSITIDERRILHEMHDIYHNELSGNGDLDSLMKAADNLPITT